MYGGMNRNAEPRLKAGDEKFIEEVARASGSRERGSVRWVDQGFEFYRADDLAMAMRRFNQAWLLNPNNPDVYWGFASVLMDRNQYCQALNMIELAIAKGPIQPGFWPDAALIYTGCGREDSNLAADVRERYYAKSDELFAKALADPAVSKGYTLFHWARAMYAREDYKSAWVKVQEYRKMTGKEFASGFLTNLRAKMPEPRSQ